IRRGAPCWRAMARTIRIERMVYRGDQFHVIRKFLRLPRLNPVINMNNALMKQGQKFAERILPKKKMDRRKIKKSLVE
ncbi:MAG TPA: hypothetical protein PLF42_17065, partial [Anaerolineales bacterium]|nr:hypothetical protein [Anaerolineales bacterium]